MRKSDGGYTYFVPDVGTIDQVERGLCQAINVQGSDHHSTVTRCAQACSAGDRVPAGPSTCCTRVR